MRCKYHFLSGLIGLIFLGVCVAGQADNPSVIVAPAQPTPSTNVNVGHCPPPEQLVLNDLFWGAPGGWISYTESFDKKVIGFEKAQWQGVNVGKILCIYKGDGSLTFPIVLEQKHHQIVPEPKFANWTINQGGYKDCVASRIEDCPFELTRDIKVADPYQEIDFFKNRNK
ncbi:MAG: T4SS-associated protein EirA [Gammaproteobacteria bacterium]